MKKNLILIGLLVSIFMIWTISCGTPQVKKNSDFGYTYGKGYGQIYQNDVALAKDRAVRDAKKDAVKRKLGEMIKNETVVQDGQWVSGSIIAKAKGLVKDYRVISEKKEGEVYVVELKAKVERRALKDMVQQMLDDMEKPVVFGVVQETYIDKGRKEKHELYDNVSLQAFSKSFAQKGFIVSKTSQWQNKLQPPVSIKQIAALSEEEVDFDLMLYGKSTCKNKGRIQIEGYRSNQLSAQADVEMTLFDINTGKVISSESIHAAKTHMNFKTACNRAIKKAMSKVSKRMYDRLLRNWEKSYGSGKRIILEINGSATYKQVNRLENEIREQFRNVVDVIEKSYSDTKIVLFVMFKGRMTDFIQEINEKKTTLKLKVVRRRGKKLILSVQ